MNSFSVHLSYPSSSPASPSVPPASRPRSEVSNRIACPRGIVGCYDMTELSDHLRYFGISEETRKAITKTKKSTSLAARGSTAKSTQNNTLYANHNAHFKSREHLNETPVLRLAASRSCYVDFTGSFKDRVRAQSLPLVTRHSSPPVKRHPRSVAMPGKRLKPPLLKPTRKQAVACEPAHIKDGLLVIANGQIVDLKKDIKQSKKLDDKERKRLREEMREHMDIVRSFDKLLEEFDATKLQLEDLKTS